MLVLTRKLKESVTIGDVFTYDLDGIVITITVVEIVGKQVKLAIATPHSRYFVHRTEVFERILDEGGTPTRVVGPRHRSPQHRTHAGGR